MSANVFLMALALGVGQAPKEVSDADKQAFFKLLSSLESEPAGHAAIFTQKSVKKAAPFAPVLFALTEKDLQKKEFAPFLLLTLQLAEIDEARRYGVKNFARIAHPRIKLFWANALFQANAAPHEVVAHLRHALEQEGEHLDHIYGPMFQAFKERVILADEIAKQPALQADSNSIQDFARKDAAVSKFLGNKGD